jgi:hypothetical protein
LANVSEFAAIGVTGEYHMRGAAKIDGERAAGRRKARLSLYVIDEPPLPTTAPESTRRQY